MGVVKCSTTTTDSSPASSTTTRSVSEQHPSSTSQRAAVMGSKMNRSSAPCVAGVGPQTASDPSSLVASLGATAGVPQQRRVANVFGFERIKHYDRFYPKKSKNYYSSSVVGSKRCGSLYSQKKSRGKYRSETMSSSSSSEASESGRQQKSSSRPPDSPSSLKSIELSRKQRKDSTAIRRLKLSTLST